MKLLLLITTMLCMLFVAKSEGLECYVCDSDFEPNCHNMYSRDVRTENCDDSRMIGYQRSVCLKTVSFEYGNRKTVRGCAKAGPRRDPCLERRSLVDISVCEMCDHHLCNGAIRALGKMNWLLLIPTAFVVFKKYF